MLRIGRGVTRSDDFYLKLGTTLLTSGTVSYQNGSTRANPTTFSFTGQTVTAGQTVTLQVSASAGSTAAFAGVNLSITLVAPANTYTDQTRTFNYTGTDLTSTTNPENGTVSYQYDGAHHVTKKTDAYGQETRYSYDAYGRLTQVQHWSGSPLAERTNERVDYYYDTNPCSGSFSQNAWGRLTAVNFKIGDESQGCVYQYSYSQAGRVTSQKMTWKLGDPGQSGPQTFDLVAGYEWDNEGRMTSLTYPGVNATGPK